MSFAPPRPRTVRWRPAEGEGLEHLTVTPSDDGIAARGVVIGERGGRPFGVAYAVDCDRDWTVRHLTLHATGGPHLTLSGDGLGHWSEGGRPRPDLDGCIDIDLAGSPFTNTLPIRRLRWSEPGPVELRMVYIPFDTFIPTVDGQRYTQLSPRLYRYEAADRSFAATLPVDDDGLVLDYPTLFRRIDPGDPHG